MGSTAKRFRFSLKAAFIWIGLLCALIAAVVGVGRLRAEWRTLNGLQDSLRQRGPWLATPEEYGGDLLPTWLAWVTPLKGRRVLKLTVEQIEDHEFRYVARFSALEELTVKPLLHRSPRLSSGLAQLARLRQLRVLDLTFTNVTDESLAYLTELDQLEELNISFTYVTDEGIGSLTSLHNLRELNLTYTSCSEEGVNALRKALPDCNVQFTHYKRLTPAENEWNDLHAKELSLRRSRETQ